MRTCLPNYAPWYVWTHFEFIDDEGRVNEIDALILAPGGLFLVEINLEERLSWYAGSGCGMATSATP